LIQKLSRSVIIAVDDMFFVAKIRAAAETLGVGLRTVRNIETLINMAREGQTDLIVVDLHILKLDPLEVARSLKADKELARIQLLGFFSHVQTELQGKRFGRRLRRGDSAVAVRARFGSNFGRELCRNATLADNRRGNHLVN
jgi:ActR/RegA family two-component response regulator